MIFDLHVHSKYSFDSIMNPKKIVRVARKKGLNGVAIVDHGTIKGGKEVLKHAKEVEDFLGICGTEITTSQGDIIGLFLNDEIETKTALEVIDEIKDQGGITILAHPFKRTDNPNIEIARKVDAIEGFNARGNQPFDEEKNYKAQLLGRNIKKPLTAGSDAHFYFEIGRGRIVTGYVNDEEDLINTIRKGIMRIEGEKTTLYAEPLSQILRIAKLKRFGLIIPTAAKFIDVTKYYAYKWRSCKDER